MHRPRQLKEAACASAMATAFIVKEYANDIGAQVGFNIATFGFVEVARPAVVAADARLALPELALIGALVKKSQL